MAFSCWLLFAAGPETSSLSYALACASASACVVGGVVSGKMDVASKDECASVAATGVGVNMSFISFIPFILELLL